MDWPSSFRSLNEFIYGLSNRSWEDVAWAISISVFVGLVVWISTKCWYRHAISSREDTIRRQAEQFESDLGKLDLDNQTAQQVLRVEADTQKGLLKIANAEKSALEGANERLASDLERRDGDIEQQAIHITEQTETIDALRDQLANSADDYERLELALDHITQNVVGLRAENCELSKELKAAKKSSEVLNAEVQRLLHELRAMDKRTRESEHRGSGTTFSTDGNGSEPDHDSDPLNIN